MSIFTHESPVPSSPHFKCSTLNFTRSIVKWLNFLRYFYELNLPFGKLRAQNLPDILSEPLFKNHTKADNFGLYLERKTSKLKHCKIQLGTCEYWKYFLSQSRTPSPIFFVDVAERLANIQLYQFQLWPFMRREK